MEAVQVILESQHKKLNSPISQYFHDSYSVSPIQNEQPSATKMSIEFFRESELQSQNMLDSHSSQIFQNQDSYTTFLEQPLEEKLYQKRVQKSCRSPHNNFKNLLLSLSIGWKHNCVNWSIFIGIRKLSLITVSYTHLTLPTIYSV